MLLSYKDRLRATRACLGWEHPEEGRPQGQVGEQGEDLRPATQEGQQQEGLPAKSVAPTPHHWRLRMFFRKVRTCAILLQAATVVNLSSVHKGLRKADL